MEPLSFFENLVSTYQVTRCHNQKRFGGIYYRNFQYRKLRKCVTKLWYPPNSLHSAITNVSKEYIATILRTENGGSVFLRNFGTHLPDYKL
jgi:hypothetical protein